MNINLGTIIKSILFVAVISVIYFIVDREVGTFYAWSVVFLILVNVYFVYRMSIRNSLNKKLFGEGVRQESTYNSQIVPQDDNVDLEKQQSNYEKFQSNYDACPSCESKLIQGLDYCEECGMDLNEHK